MLTEDELRALLAGGAGAKVAVLGDFCLDVYWHVDPNAAEPSLETGLETRPVSAQRCALGGAGNVVANLRALGCGHVRAFGVVGDDLWGRELLALLRADGAETGGMHTAPPDWATLVYIKPHLHERESHRFDFGHNNALADTTAESLLRDLEAALPEVDVVIVNQQVRQGIHTPAFREGLAALVAAHPARIFLVDSRHHSGEYPGAWLKLNDHEAARLVGIRRAPDALVLHEDVCTAAEHLWNRTQRPVFITRGARGLCLRDAAGLHEIPGLQTPGRIDVVGAGDSVLAGMAMALAAGAPPVRAAELGGLVAAVTIRKLRQTGTATPDEVLAVGRHPAYIYRPELAEDPRRARYHAGSEIESVTHPRTGFRATHAIFDHDGTLSTLREGWERVMEPMMIHAILGDRFALADESLYRQVVDRVRAYIDASTGVQTLVQMEGLVRLVVEFGCVAPAAIRDAAGYKAIYNDALMGGVRRRLARLRCGELGVEDFTLKNAVAMLTALHGQGVRLFLASGTDAPDVRAEAEALGYAELFEGRIYGAVGDVTREAKREVLERILSDVGNAAAGGLVTFGDGPVEIRETHRVGGLAVGIASDEIRRFGVNMAKRTRLIHAGADLIISDFSQLDRLLPLLGLRPQPCAR